MGIAISTTVTILWEAVVPDIKRSFMYNEKRYREYEKLAVAMDHWQEAR